MIWQHGFPHSIETDFAAKSAYIAWPTFKLFTRERSLGANWKLRPLEFSLAVAIALLVSTFIISQHGDLGGGGTGWAAWAQEAANANDARKILQKIRRNFLLAEVRLFIADSAVGTDAKSKDQCSTYSRCLSNC
jgi:hypothetical protein